jgi:N-acetyl-anhydromuramyl-L-alanine amidase AmpD
VTPLPDRRPADSSQVYAQVVERYARLFDHPGARLRFLNNTLAKQAARQEELRRSLQRFQFLKNTPFYAWIMEARLYSSILEELRAQAVHIPAQQRARLEEVDIPFKARFVFFCQRFRHVFLAGGLLASAFLLFGLYSLVMWSGQKVSAYIAQKNGAAQTAQGNGKPTQVNANGNNSFNDTLNILKSEKVWQVSENSESEEWSNGARILKANETTHRPRSYYLIPRNSESGGNQIRHSPIGIIYHTSENELTEFTPDQSDSIEKRSANVIRYIRNNRSYNYLIDRFGRIHRIVRDDHAANHAGNSIWADEKNVYVGLNESFIGVCFEASVKEGTLEKIITEAQFLACRQLTSILRAKYNIDDANCTTHGLVSVNPETGLIGFHNDWAKDFPFDAIGLSDKYQIQPASMTDYGFTWDDEVLNKPGMELWPGAKAADEKFNQRAERARISVDALRLKLRERYKEQYARQKALQTPTTAGR